jgi:hypothetical protein
MRIKRKTPRFIVHMCLDIPNIITQGNDNMQFSGTIDDIELYAASRRRAQ